MARTHNQTFSGYIIDNGDGCPDGVVISSLADAISLAANGLDQDDDEKPVRRSVHLTFLDGGHYGIQATEEDEGYCILRADQDGCPIEDWSDLSGAKKPKTPLKAPRGLAACTPEQRSAAGRKAALTRKRRAAGRKAAETRRRNNN